MCPRRARAFSPSEGERERSAVPAGFPQKAREVPNLGTRILHATACRPCRRPAAGELLPGGSRGLQKGVQDTTKDVVSYTPSCDSP